MAKIQPYKYSITISIVNIIIFTVFWLLFSEYNVLKYGYWRTFIAIYFVCICLYVYLNSIYDSFAIGRRRISENVFSISLSCLFFDLLFYFLQTATFKVFDSIIYVFLSIIVQFLANILMYKSFHSTYFKNYTRKKTLILYNSNDDLLKIVKTPYFDKKYNLVNSINKIDLSLFNISDYEVIFMSGIDILLRNIITEECIEQGVDLYIIPQVGDVIMSGSKYVEESFIPMVMVTKVSVNPLYLLLKRLFDIFVSVIALIIFFPLMLITAIAIKAYDGGPILYKQTRLTINRKMFTILKFRSMKVDAEKDGVARLVSEHDDRITPIGKIIRAIRFDELPQLFNILKGDMSIVGPRPERPEIAEQYEKEYTSFRLRLQVKAGLTGYAQIYGKYNTEPLDKIKMDLYYINKMSFLYDIQLCFMTIKTIFMKDSTSAIEEGKITASK